MSLIMTQGSTSLNYAEFRTLLIRCADLINSRPLGVLLNEDKIQPLTPNHLLIGRTYSREICEGGLDKGAQKFTRRAKYVADLARTWWEKWFAQCFSTLLPFKGWVQR